MEKEKMNEEIIRRAVVTGATGLRWCALVKELVGRGIEVLALCPNGFRAGEKAERYRGRRDKGMLPRKSGHGGKRLPQALRRFFSFGVAGNYGRSAQRRLSSKRKRALCVGRSQRGKAFRV